MSESEALFQFCLMSNGDLLAKCRSCGATQLIAINTISFKCIRCGGSNELRVSVGAQSLKIEIRGSRGEIEAFIENIERDWNVRATSRFIQSNERGSLHIYLDVTPKREVTA